MGGLTATMLAGSCSAKGRIENDYYATPFHATKAILDDDIIKRIMDFPEIITDKEV